MYIIISMYVHLAIQKTDQHWKEEKYASMGDEYSHNFTNLCFANLWSII